MIRIGLPDLISPSYFPIVAAADLGLLADEGVDADIRLVFPVVHALEQMRGEALDLVAGCAHGAVAAFPGWQGVRLVGAISQNTYWFLVVRPELSAAAADLRVLSGTTIGAAPTVDLPLRHLLRAADVAGVDVVPVPGSFLDADRNFGLAAARALEAGAVDGFWANGMAAELAVRSGSGTVVLDARRGGGPPGTNRMTFAALMAPERLLTARPAVLGAVRRGLVAAQRALREEPALAGRVAAERFPAREAALMDTLVARDAAFYDIDISRERVETLQRFQIESGLLDTPAHYANIVATTVG